jgi:glycosyltransferase involved in cell wall biosynthesis
VVTLNDGAPAAELRQSGVQVDVFPEDRMGFAAIATAIIRLARAFKPDVIHSHRYKEHLLAAMSAPLCGAVHVRTAHGLPPQTKEAGGLARLGSLWDAALSTAAGSHWIAVSEELVAHISGVRRDVRVVPNGLPAVVPPPARQELLDAFGLPDPVRIVGFVGRLEAVKRPDRFIRIVRALPPVIAGAPVVAILAGDGSQRDSVGRLVGAEGLESRVRVLGAVDHGDRIVGALDVLVIPSDHEGHPMVLLEAMRAGTAVVASRVGGIPEVLGDAPWVLPPTNESAMADAVRRLLEDDAERDTWCRSLRRSFAERYTIATTVDRTLTLYRDLLGTAAETDGSGSTTS